MLNDKIIIYSYQYPEVFFSSKPASERLKNMRRYGPWSYTERFGSFYRLSQIIQQEQKHCCCK